MKKIKFAKFVAAGNDFVIINNYDKKILPKRYPVLAKKLCHPKFGIGADGILFIEPSLRRDCEFKMVYYNADGSFAEMCGNGARCIAYYAYELEICDDVANFETAAGVVNCIIKKGGRVKIKLTDPKFYKPDISIKLDDGKELTVSFINTGVPHTVLFVDDIEKIDVVNLGRQIRYHKVFSPEGTNVDFVKIVSSGTATNCIYIRTYERGVENETLSCGTGAVASSVIASLKGYVDSPVSCITKSGEVLKISFKKNSPEDMLSPVSNVYLEGKVYHVFDGEIFI